MNARTLIDFCTDEKEFYLLNPALEYEEANTLQPAVRLGRFAG